MEKGIKKTYTMVILNLVFTSSMMFFIAFSFHMPNSNNAALLSPSYSTIAIQDDELAVHSRNVSSNVSSTTDDSSSSSSRCISASRDLEAIVNNAGQIFNLHIPKAGGTTMGLFTHRCNGEVTEDEIEYVLGDKYRKTSLLGNNHHELHTFNLLGVKKFIHLVQSATDESLIIYHYRSETERLLSAIKHVVKTRYCTETLDDQEYLKNGIRTEDKCIVYEQNLINMIENRVAEINIGNKNIFTCETFNIIEESKPNFVLYNMQHLDQLQSAYAKKYCPELEGQKFHENDGSTRRNDVLVRFGEQSGEHPRKPDMLLNDWVEKKRNFIEWSLDLYRGGSCRGKLRELANELSSCVENGGVGLVLSSVQ